MKHNRMILLILATAISLIGCSPKTVAVSNQMNRFVSEKGVPDYSQLNYWASHPNKKDPGDTVPKPLKENDLEKVADVFFLHPTTLTDIERISERNGRIDDDGGLEEELDI
jgi:hypothetical protein